MALQYYQLCKFSRYLQNFFFFFFLFWKVSVFILLTSMQRVNIIISYDQYACSLRLFDQVSRFLLGPTYIPVLLISLP